MINDKTVTSMVLYEQEKQHQADISKLIQNKQNIVNKLNSNFSKKENENQNNHVDSDNNLIGKSSSTFYAVNGNLNSSNGLFQIKKFTGNYLINNNEIIMQIIFLIMIN